MRLHTTHTRDAALRQLRRINLWLIAGSITLTGVLTDAAAHAFPGKTLNTSASSKSGSHSHSSSSAPSTTSSQPLHPPEQAPQASSEPAPAQESPPARESAPTPEASHESAPAPEASHESAPAPEPSAPVVSGGS